MVGGVGRGMDVWELLERPGDRVPLVTEGEARAAAELLRLLEEHEGAEVREAATELRRRLARRLPSAD